MIFVDTNVFIYAVGRAHPLKAQARSFFSQSIENQQDRLVTSAEVLQELLHAYLPVGRFETLAAALELTYRATDQIWPLEPDDVLAAHALATEYPALGARDLIHLASCRRRGSSGSRLMTALCPHPLGVNKTRRRRSGKASPGFSLPASGFSKIPPCH